MGDAAGGLDLRKIRRLGQAAAANETLLKLAHERRDARTRSWAINLLIACAAVEVP